MTVALAAALAAALSAGAQEPPPVRAPAPPRGPEVIRSPSILHRVVGPNDRLEMTVNSSRILTMDQKIPQVQVNNPEILELTPLSPTQVQVAAKKPGVTQINLWGENKQICTVDVTVIGDARELAMILRSQFPATVLSVVPMGGALMISGYVDQPRQIPIILEIAKEYYPKIINNMNVSGVQQGLLHVKVMEVSRTKLRQLGFDFAKFNGAGNFVSQVSGLISSISGGSMTLNNPTVQFNIGHSGSAFFGVLNALRQDGLAKILSEPTLVAISGRPAHFNVGGQYYYQLNGGITGPSTSFVNYGTIVDVVPIILGNGRIRLEVRAEVSEIDKSLTVVGGPPSLKIRMVETGVEMKAGQTLAIAGLVQNTVDSQNSGLPWISEVPYLGVPFRNVQEQINEVETLIMVTPELIEALDANQVPPCGPGMETASPSDWELYFKGHLEVPVCCAGNGAAGVAGGPRSSGEPATAPPCAPPVPPASGPDGDGGSPQNRYPAPNPNNSNRGDPAAGRNVEPPFIGPIGYDAVP
jgi:pilus assembly protein CpaC